MRGQRFTEFSHSRTALDSSIYLSMKVYSRVHKKILSHQTIAPIPKKSNYSKEAFKRRYANSECHALYIKIHLHMKYDAFIELN